MVFVPATTVEVAGEQKTVSPFIMDRYEVTNREFYENYVQKKGIHRYDNISFV